MAKFKVAVEVVVSRELVIDAPNKAAVENFFDNGASECFQDLSLLASSDVDIRKIGEIKQTRSVPDMRIDAAGDVIER